MSRTTATRRAALAARLLVLGLGAGVAGCQTPQEPPTAQGATSTSAAPARGPLAFLDLPSFDQRLAGALGAQPPRVDVVFLDRVSPSALPTRLQSWIAAVESGGGAVRVVPDPSGPSARSLILIGALTSLWSAYKAKVEIAERTVYRAAREFDARIELRDLPGGGSVVERVVFVPRAR
jgi:hypothetical protein